MLDVNIPVYTLLAYKWGKSFRLFFCIFILANVSDGLCSPNHLSHDSGSYSNDRTIADTAVVNSKIERGWGFYGKNRDSFYFYFNQVDSLCEYYLDSRFLLTNDLLKFYRGAYARSLSCRGFYAHRKLWDFDAALQYYRATLVQLEYTGGDTLYAQTINNLANVYESLGDIPSAIRHYYHILEFYKSSKDSVNLAFTLDDLGLMKLYFGEKGLAYDYFLSAYNVFLAQNKKEYLALPIVHLGYVHTLRGECTKADSFFQQAYTLANEGENVFQLAIICRYWGYNYKEQGNYLKAIDTYLKGLNCAEVTKYEKGQSILHLHLSKVYYELNEIEKSRYHAARSLEIAEKTKIIRNRLDAAKWIGELYEKDQDFTKALKYHKLSDSLEKSLFTFLNHKDLISQHIKQTYENSNLLQRLELNVKQNQRNALAAFGAVLLFGVIILFLRLRLLQKDKEILDAERKRVAGLEIEKSKFYTNITHEFRAPLTLIMGLSERILKKKTFSVAETVSQIKGQSIYLLDLINQILDLTKLESNQMTLKLSHGDIVSFIGSFISSYNQLFQQKNIKLQFSADPGPIMMDFDSGKIKMVLHNLLSNALKFTNSGGTVKVGIKMSPEHREKNKENQLILKIQDSGIGIPNEELSSVFDRFYQVDHKDQAPGEGTGIGLSIVKEIIRLLNGSIRVSSEVGEGTCFVIALPITKKALPGYPVQENNMVLSPPADSKPDIVRDYMMRDIEKNDALIVLIAEDQEDIKHYLASCLSDQFVVYTARNGNEAFAKATELIPDLIISDVMMPGISGLELCQRLKSDEVTSHIPFIILSGKTDMDSKINGLKHGADAYLFKPFYEEELMLQANNLLDLRHKQKEKFLNLKRGPRTITILPEEEFILKLKSYIEENLGKKEIAIQDLCKLVNLSRMQLHRKIKALTGLSTSYYISHVKLERAHELLIHSHYNISEIAYQVGFEDPKYFSRLFNEKYGSSPSQLIKLRMRS